MVYLYLWSFLDCTSRLIFAACCLFSVSDLSISIEAVLSLLLNFSFSTFFWCLYFSAYQFVCLPWGAFKISYVLLVGFAYLCLSLPMFQSHTWFWICQLYCGVCFVSGSMSLLKGLLIIPIVRNGKIVEQINKFSHLRNTISVYWQTQEDRKQT